MKLCRSIILSAILLLCTSIGASAQKRTDPSVASLVDSVAINFRQSKWDLDLNVGNNASVLDGIDRRLTTILNDSLCRLRHITVFGGASPEGSVEFNKFLSERRAETLFRWFDKYNQLSDTDKTFTFIGRDWEGVLRLAEKDPLIPYRNETLSMLRAIAGGKRASGGEEPKGGLERLKTMCGGEPYLYLYRNIFPKVRASKIVIEYEQIPATVIKRDTVYVERVVEVRETVYIDTCNKRRRNRSANNVQPQSR